MPVNSFVIPLGDGSQMHIGPAHEVIGESSPLGPIELQCHNPG
jgi:hypothetical protein